MKSLVVEKDKLTKNIELIKGMTSSKIIAVLKGNGYGLGIKEFAKILLENDIDFFAVSDLEEALELREGGFDNNILLLTSTSNTEEIESIIQSNIIPTIGSINSALALNEAGKRMEKVIDVHLKIDTGFGRFGFISEQMAVNYPLLKSLNNLNITGTFSHLSFAFTKEPKLIHSQFDKFIKCVDGLKVNGIETGMLHIANSCAFLRFEGLHLDAVRIGSAFLGRIPIENKFGFFRIGYMKSELIEYKDLPKDHFIGYANTYKTKHATRIGIVPVGYKDGFGVEKTRDTFRFRDILRYVYNDLKLLRKHYYVKINEKKVRILGRISMFNIVIDLTGIEAEIGDKVILDINPVLIDSSIKREYL
jgi:alanine racemase